MPNHNALTPWTNGKNLWANIDTLGKIENKDLLTVADDSGRLRRKTNFVTRRLNQEKTDDSMLCTQLEEILQAASDDMRGNSDPAQHKRFVAAYRGVERLQSTYRAKGSERLDRVDSLMYVLAKFDPIVHQTDVYLNTSGETRLQVLARDAITFVDNACITSTNTTQQPSHFGYEEDDWLLWMLVRSATLPSKDRMHQELRRVVRALIDSPRLTNSQKREELGNWLCEQLGIPNAQSLKQTLIQYWRQITPNDFSHSETPVHTPLQIKWDLWWLARDTRAAARAEHLRIKAVRRAMKSRLGNCLEKSSIVATHIAEASRGGVGICIVTGGKYDHHFVLISNQKEELLSGIDNHKETKSKKSLPRDTWVVDGWRSDYWCLRDTFNSIPNARQLGTRYKIRDAFDNGAVTLWEEVYWPPEGVDADFRLRFATVSEHRTSHQQMHQMLQGDYRAALSLLLNPQRAESNLSDGFLDDSLIGE